VTSLRQAGVRRGDLVALVISARWSSGWPRGELVDGPWVAAEIGRADEELRRAGALVGPDGGAARRGRGPAGYVLGHRRGAPAAVRRLAGRPGLGLGPAARPGHRHDAADGPLDLFGMDVGDTGDPVAPDGHLRPEWVSGGWSDSPERMLAGPPWPWTSPGSSRPALAALDDRPMALPTARAESTAELLCAEAVRGRAADGPGCRRTGPDLLDRSQATQRSRRLGATGRP